MTRKRKRRILRIGLTGGIGGGKSVVAAMFKKLGAAVLSADEIARNLTEKNPTIKKEIWKEFGPQVFSREGLLDRKRMADIVFSNRERKEKLNAIIHPFVLKKIEEEISRLEESSNATFVIHEAALIYEAGADKDLDYVIVVDAAQETRIRRVMERDGVSRADVLRRIRSQMPVEEKREMADFIIDNDGDIVSLENKVKFLYGLFLKIGHPATV